MFLSGGPPLPRQRFRASGGSGGRRRRAVETSPAATATEQFSKIDRDESNGAPYGTRTRVFGVRERKLAFLGRQWT